MRLFATEYSAGTAELLLTLPLSPWQIVLGKFLGAVTILLAHHRRHPDRPGPALPVRHPGDHDHPGWLHRLPAARHGVPRRGPALLDRDPQPDRGRAAHRRGAAGLLVRRPSADASRPRRRCAAWSAISRSRCTSPTSSRAWFAPRASPSTWSSARDRPDPERQLPAVATLSLRPLRPRGTHPAGGTHPARRPRSRCTRSSWRRHRDARPRGGGAAAGGGGARGRCGPSSPPSCAGAAARSRSVHAGHRRRPARARLPLGALSRSGST